MSDVLSPLKLEEEDIMKKFGYIVAALATIAIAAPTIASAETIVIKRGGGYHEAIASLAHAPSSVVIAIAAGTAVTTRRS